MKRFTAFICAACVAGRLAASLAADESIDIWTQIYRESRTDAAKYQVMLKIMDFRNKDFTPMIQDSLDDLYNRRIESGGTTEKYDKTQLARLMVQELGNLKATDAADRIFAIYQDVGDAYLKSDCAIALGKLRATTFAYRLARDLADINLAAKGTDTRPQEVLAYGIIQALDSLRSPLSFEPLFLASLAWYPNSSHVRELAKQVLPKIFPDPSEQLMTIIEKNDRLEVKLAALEAEIASKAPTAAKIGVARLALGQALNLSPSVPEAIGIVTKLRRLAVTSLSQLGDKDPASAALFIQQIARDRANQDSFDDTILCYTALGWNASAAAVKFLNERLAYYNDAQRSGKNTVRDKQIVREVIAAIKRAKNPESRPILMRTQYVDNYDNAIIADAIDALAAIPEK
jgi:hypothetical protein